MRSRGGVIAVLVVLVLLATFVSYRFWPVEIQQKVHYTCSDPGHVGERNLKTYTPTIRVARKDIEGSRDRYETEVCPICQARNEAKREQEEQEAREREEAEAIFQNLEVVKYGLIPSDNAEESLPLGGEVYPHIMVANNGSEPVSGIKFAVRPAEYLVNRPEAYIWESKVAESERLLELLTTSGLPVTDFNRGGDTVMPRNSKYYPSGTGQWAYYNAMPDPHDGLPLAYKDVSIKLNPSLPPGQDIQLRYYLIYKGAEKQVGTVTIHVMYPG